MKKEVKAQILSLVKEQFEQSVSTKKKIKREVKRLEVAIRFEKKKSAELSRLLTSTRNNQTSSLVASQINSEILSKIYGMTFENTRTLQALRNELGALNSQLGISCASVHALNSLMNELVPFKKTA